MISAETMSIEELLVKLKTLKSEMAKKGCFANEHGKYKIMVGGLDLDLLMRSGKVTFGVCQKGVGSNAILSCGDCLRWIHKKCSDIKGPYPDFRCA